MTRAIRLLPFLLIGAMTACGGGGAGSNTSTSSNTPSPPVIPASPAPTVTFSVSQVVAGLNQAVKLTWSSTNTTTCTASGGWSGTKSTAGEETVTAGKVGNTIYQISCVGAGGTAAAQTSLDAFPSSSSADAVSKIFDTSLMGATFKDVLGVSKKPTDYSKPSLILGIPAKTGDTVTALSIIEKVNPVIDQNAVYRFGLHAPITSIWDFLDTTNKLNSKILLDGLQISRPPLFPGTVYPSQNNSRSIVMYDVNWFASRPDYWMPDGGSGPYFVEVPGSELARISFLIGGEMSLTIYTEAPPNGNFQAIVIRDFFSDSTPATATTTEYLTALTGFGTRFKGVRAPHGCTLITQMVSAAIGAPLPAVIWKTVPAENPTRAGHWTAIYKGDSPSANPNWTEITKPGDVINLVFNSGAQHTLSVISVSGKNIETIDNSAGFIGGRVYSPENQSSPTSVTVYRMDSAYDSSASRTFNWLEGLYPSFFPGGATTELSNGYVLRQYSTKWALGVKNGALYVLNGSTLKSYSIGSTESFLQFANRNGF